jgi:1,4-alpha-glucan branching enzyme
LYKGKAPLHELDFQEAGFAWTQLDRQNDAILCYERIGKDDDDFLLVVMNADQQTHFDYPVNVREGYSYSELLNTDDERWGGSGILNTEDATPAQNAEGQAEIRIMIPPVSLLIFEPKRII